MIRCRFAEKTVQEGVAAAQQLKARESFSQQQQAKLVEVKSEWNDAPATAQQEVTIATTIITNTNVAAATCTSGL